MYRDLKLVLEQYLKTRRQISKTRLPQHRTYHNFGDSVYLSHEKNIYHRRRYRVGCVRATNSFSFLNISIFFVLLLNVTVYKV